LTIFAIATQQKIAVFARFQLSKNKCHNPKVL